MESNTKRAWSARNSETALSIVSDWTLWVIAAAPALAIGIALVKNGETVWLVTGIACLYLAVMSEYRRRKALLISERDAIIRAMTTINDQLERRANIITSKYDTLSQEAASTVQTITDLRSELDLSTAILEGTVEPATRGRIPAYLRRHIHKRCANTCQFCARPGTTEQDPDGETWHIEHVIPVNKGGPTQADNLTLACSSCNLRKGTMPAYAFIQKLIREGVRKQ